MKYLESQGVCFVAGQPCWFLFQISPIKDDEEEVILFLITFKDISNLKDPISGMLNCMEFLALICYKFMSEGS